MHRWIWWGLLLALVLGGAGGCGPGQDGVKKSETLPTHRLPGKRLPP
jgi:hypothetical protein